MAVNVTPDGSVPVIDKVGVGAPVVVTVKLLADVMVNVALLRLVMTGDEVGNTMTVPEAALAPTELRAVTEHA